MTSFRDAFLITTICGISGCFCSWSAASEVEEHASHEGAFSRMQCPLEMQELWHGSTDTVLNQGASGGADKHVVGRTVPLECSFNYWVNEGTCGFMRRRPVIEAAGRVQGPELEADHRAFICVMLKSMLNRIQQAQMVWDGRTRTQFFVGWERRPGSHQPTHESKRRNMMMMIPPVISGECGKEFSLRMLGGTECEHDVCDGSKLICVPEWNDEDAEPSPCLIYSFGSSGDLTFEKDIMLNWGRECELHVFDCFSIERNETGEMDMNGTRIFLHKWCLDVVNEEYLSRLSFRSIVARLGHEGRDIDMLKLDVEGWEWYLFEDLAAYLYEHKALIHQISFELHSRIMGTFPEIQLGSLDHARLFALIYRLGYDFVSWQPNAAIIEVDCAEFTVFLDRSVARRLSSHRAASRHSSARARHTSSAPLEEEGDGVEVASTAGKQHDNAGSVTGGEGGRGGGEEGENCASWKAGAGPDSSLTAGSKRTAEASAATDAEAKRLGAGERERGLDEGRSVGGCSQEAAGLLSDVHVVYDGFFEHLMSGAVSGISKMWSNILPFMAAAVRAMNGTLSHCQGSGYQLDGIESVSDCHDLNDKVGSLPGKHKLVLSSFYRVAAPNATAGNVCNFMPLYDFIPERMQIPLSPSQSEHLRAKTGNLPLTNGFLSLSNNTTEDLEALHGISRLFVATSPNRVSPLFKPMSRNLPFDYANVFPGADHSRLFDFNSGTKYILLNGYEAGGMEYKGYDLFWEALARMPHSFQSEFAVLNIGKQPSHPELKIVSQLWSLGNVEEEILPHIYSRAAVFVYPSRYEGFGMPPIEAIACGCPVILGGFYRARMRYVYGDDALYAATVEEMVAALHTVARGEVASAATLVARAQRYGGDERYGWNEVARDYLEYMLTGPFREVPGSSCPVLLRPECRDHIRLEATVDGVEVRQE